MLEGLNEQQLEAVTTIDGPVMVMAGAGSGKTRVLTERIAYILEQGISPYHVLAVTFTNKAANEMKQRIAKMIDIDTKYMWISTFHSFCSRLLRLEVDYALPPYNHNFLILDEEDSLKVVKEILKAEEIEEIKPKRIKDLISKTKNFPNYKVGDPHLADIFTRVYHKYNSYLMENNMLDFDDLIIKTIELFKKNTDILNKYQEKFQYILVDEFQDTNDLQYKLIFMLASRYHNLFVVGDDFQSIYSFRGAQIENIERFRKDFKENKLILLEENYRSTKQILNLANVIIDHNPNQIKKVMFSKKLEGQLPFYYQASSGKQEAQYVVDNIKKFHISGDAYSDFAIIYRTNSISRVFEDTLIKYQIPYKIYGGFSFFARKEIKDMIAYIRVILNPEDDFSFNRIVNEPKRKIGSVLLERLNMLAVSMHLSLFNAIPYFEGTGLGAKALKEFHQMICSIKEQINNIPLKNLIDIILEESGYKAMLSLEDDDHERIGNIFELKNILKELEQEAVDNIDALRSFLNDVSLRTDQDEQEEKDCVILTTYHQAKGLEFKNVFLVAMEEGIFPSEYHFEDLDIEEERRICYVGITRAKERLYVTNAISRMMYGRIENTMPSRFIKEMGQTHLKNITAELFKKSAFDDKNNFKEKLTQLKSTVKTGEDLNVGDKVEHAVFGIGIIVSVGSDNSVKIAFPSPTGIKTLMKNHPSYHKIYK
ncbi:MAG: UvrD-helicase domain-containing protein, partial [Anaeroplasmataceae bacterium]|nr:UvrD-helicase domain-containing protein [Anaeroplasmataceae bacterium]